MPLDPATVTLAVSAAKQVYKIWKSNPGSKVKKGAFAGCPLEMYGSKACIQLTKRGDQVLLLTSDNVDSYEFVEEKEKLSVKGLHTYYYYEITYTDGSSSILKMRKKYVDAMKRYV